MKRFVSLGLCLLWIVSSWAQTEKSWIFLSDKPANARPALSEAAQQGRIQRGIVLDQRDFPLAPAYLQRLQSLGVAIDQRSRWFNAVSASLSPTLRAQVAALPFVRAIKPVARYRLPALSSDHCDELPGADTYRRQLTMLGLDQLHQQQLTGQGVMVAVFDNGFYQADSLEAFAHLFSEGRVLASYDFVDDDNDVFGPCNHCRHGTQVLSVLAANLPGKLTGAAPGATYLLFRTEDDASETHQEEDNWVAAAEFADSLGAQVFTTSLGYRDFDAGQGDYLPGHFDGNTALITRAADLAASRGILVLNSAGNHGRGGLSAPADGDSVLAIGAVDACEQYATFSSRGPTADGRIKPDLMAMGQQTLTLSSNGQVHARNGTSFSCPLVAGLAACLWQAAPDASSHELREALRRSGDRFSQPNNQYGYGIPTAGLAYEALTRAALPPGSAIQPFRQNPLLVYPNPNTGSFTLTLDPALNLLNARIEVFDATGAQVASQVASIGPAERLVMLQGNFTPGLYYLRAYGPAAPNRSFSRKFVVFR
jgi:serine protease AprX